MSDPLIIDGRKFSSRLILGTGKYRSLETMAKAIESSGTQIVTVAMRRLNISQKSRKSIIDHIDRKKITLLPNTAGCHTAKEAILTSELAREALGTDMIKLEVIGDDRTLYPDNQALLEAAKELTRRRFVVLPYTSDDLVVCRKLEEVGCAAVMPLGAPIGSGLGIRNPINIQLIINSAKIPVIVDAGVGTASDATQAMELGAAGVLMNTGIARAKDPVRMASAMKMAVESGRLAHVSGRIPVKFYGSASSPVEGLIKA